MQCWLVRFAQQRIITARVISTLCRYPMNKPPHSNEATRRKPLGAIGCLAMMVLGVIFSASAIRTTPPSAKRYQCQNNLKQIALAILNYDSANGHLPPLMSLAEDGTPLHSWRIHILPFLEETDLYEKIDLNLPWNHPANLALQDDMPTVYRCPSFSDEDYSTAYVAPAGQNTVWMAGKPRKIREVTKGTSKTGLVIEAEQFRQHWMSPFDPQIAEFVATSEDGMQLNPSNHGKRIQLVYVDGSIEVLSGDTEPERIRHLFEMAAD